MHIALLGYRSNPFSGGQGIYIKYVSRALVAHGHSVDVISAEPYPHLDDNVKLIKLPGLNLYATKNPTAALKLKHLASATDFFEWASVLSGGFPEPFTFGQRAYKYLNQHGKKYDIIHDNQCLSPGILRLQKMGLPLVTTIHHPITHDRDIALAHEDHWGMRLLLKRWHYFLTMQAKVARALTHIVTVSEQAKLDIAVAFNVPQQRIHVVPNGVDTDEFKPMPEIDRSPHQLITTASADQPLKGTTHLISAFAMLRAKFPQLRLTLIGKPKPGGATQQLIDKHRLSPWIEFCHGITTEELVTLYAKATIAVVPSQYEGFGLPAAEAMACATPVVASNGGALPEVVGNAGVIVPKGDATALAGAIESLLTDSTAREHYAALGQQRISEHYQWSKTACALSDYYQHVITR